MAELVQHVPNILTISRILLIPVFVVLMNDPSEAMLSAALVVFIFASLTDYFDGFIARRYGVVSNIGKMLDPLADKIFVMAALVMLLAQRSDLTAQPWVPAWMVVMLFAREFWVTGLRGIVASRGIILAASNSAKWKTALQVVAIIALLIHRGPVFVLGIPIHFQWLGENLLLLSIAFAYWSGLEYTWTTIQSLGPQKV